MTQNKTLNQFQLQALYPASFSRLLVVVVFHSFVRDWNSIKGLTLGNASWLSWERVSSTRWTEAAELLTTLHNSLTEYLFELENWNVECCCYVLLQACSLLTPQGAD